jgi:hypothetical protein
MKLRIDALDATNATLICDDSDQIRVTVAGDPRLSYKLARAFNRDKHFDALVSALTVFRSNEMGDLLIGMIDVREIGGEQAQARLGRMVKMIDVILDAVEQLDDDQSEVAVTP